MASLESRNGHFRLIFRYHGTKYQHSLDGLDHVAAIRQQRRLEFVLDKVRAGELSMPAGADVPVFLLSEGKAGLPAPTPIPVKAVYTLRQLTEGYIAVQRGAVGKPTLRMSELNLQRVRETLGDEFDVETLTLADLQRHVDERATQPGRHGQPVQPQTIRKSIGLLGAAWCWAQQSGFVTKQFPAPGLRYARRSARPRFQTRAEIYRQLAKGNLTTTEQGLIWDRLYFTREEMEQFLAFVKTKTRQPYLAVMVAMACYTGMRRAELLRIRGADIDLETGFITVHEKKRIHGADSARVIPMAPQLRQILAPWLAQNQNKPTLFHHPPERPSLGRGGTITVARIDWHWENMRAGSEWEHTKGFHVLRHSFISACASRGIDMRIVQAWCGHMSPEMSAHYTHLCPKNQRDAINQVFQ